MLKFNITKVKIKNIKQIESSGDPENCNICKNVNRKKSQVKAFSKLIEFFNQ